MRLLDKYARVTRHCRCVKCGQENWCLIARDGSHCICPRVADGAKKSLISRHGDFVGYLHQIGDEPASEIRVRLSDSRFEEPPAIDAAFLHARYREALTDWMIEDHATQLGVTSESLRQLEIGYYAKSNAYSFPMKDGDGNIIGIRLRRPDGFKYAIAGSKSGIFIPDIMFDGRYPTLICEGPTDTAAMLSLAFQVIGRPFCRGGVQYTVDMLRGCNSEAVIVSDVDGPGVDGALSLADTLVGNGIATRIIRPLQGKDARAWLQSGATRVLVEDVIENARYHQRRAAC